MQLEPDECYNPLWWFSYILALLLWLSWNLHSNSNRNEWKLVTHCHSHIHRPRLHNCSQPNECRHHRWRTSWNIHDHSDRPERFHRTRFIDLDSDGRNLRHYDVHALTN